MRLADRLKKYAGSLIVVYALVFGGIYFAEVHHESDRASCQAQYNRAFAAALTNRAATGNDRTKAQDALLGEVSGLVTAPPAKTKTGQEKASAAFLQAFQDYQAAAAKADQAKTENPYPTFPNC